MQYHSLTFSCFHDAFRKVNRLDGWSYDGLKMLYDYLTELDTSIDDMLDIVAMDSSYMEYNGIDEIARDMGIDPNDYDNDEDEKEDCVMRYLEDRGMLIERKGDIFLMHNI